MRTKFVILPILFFLFKLSVGQQWLLSSPLLYGRDVNAIHIFNRNNVLLAGGVTPYYRTFYSSNDYGLGWGINVDIGLPVVMSIAFRDTLNGIAAGQISTLLKTANGGNSWTDITPPVSADFNKVIYINPQTLIVVGGNRLNDSLQVILKSTDGGNNWNAVYNQAGKWLKSVCFTDTLHGIAVGDSGTILKTVNGGNTWAPVTAPVQRDFNAIIFLNTSTGFIVGGKEAIDSIRTILKTSDGGTTWSVIKDETNGWLKDVTFINQDTGYAVGPLAALLKTTDAGQTWNQETISGATGTEYFNAIRFNDPNFGFVAGKGGSIYIYTNAPKAEAYTTGSDRVDTTTATFKALINTHGAPVAYSFYFSTDSNLNNSLHNMERNFTSNSLSPVNSQIFGLIPDTTYYYQVVVRTVSGMVYGDTLSFFTSIIPYVFQTDSATNITDTTAMLQGIINKFPVPVHLFFDYDTTPAFGHYVIGSPASLGDTLQHVITATINSLRPGTTYYYRLRGVTDSNATYYGDIYIFNTALPFAIFQTLVPTHVTDTSATLNGLVWRPDFPTILSFEYDTSLAFGNEVAATPASVLVSDTQQHVITATVNSLRAYTTYYYRLRGVTDSGVSYYSNTCIFSTLAPFAIFQTLAPTHVTDTSASFNGLVWRPDFPTILSFEYGNSPAFGNEVATIPPSVNDTLYHWLNVPVTGLQTGATYYYRLKGITNSGTYYGITRYFYTGTSNSIAETFPANVTSDTTAAFNGTIQGFTQPVIVNFEYGNTPAMTQQTDSYYYSDTTLWYVGGNVSGLLPNTLYYFRLRGETSIGTTYGNTLVFYTGNSNRGFQTLLATAVSPTSAQLNGQADALLLPTDLSFEYGTTRALGNVIVGTPNSVHDILQHPVSAALTGLVPNTLYYYRLMGSVSAGINFYGNTEQLYTANCEIPNCDFEVWDTAMAESPTGWSALGMSVHRVPSYNGTNAAQIIGGLLLGSVHNGLQISGGCSFPARPDSIMFYARYNIAAGDTAFVITSFSLNGTAISQEWFPITGSSGGNFILKKYKITFPTNAVPDSLALAFISSNPHSVNSLNTNSVLTIDDISFAGTNLTVPNGNFELWQSFVRENPQAWTANFGDFPATPVFEPIVKTTDHVSGNYALRIQTDPSISYKPAFILAGLNQLNQPNSPAFAVGARHNTLNGYMKYQPQNGDTLNISLNMFLHGTVIGAIYLNIDTEIIQYIPFSFNISYFSQYAADIPDSASLLIVVGSNNMRGNSVAYIDNLSFDGFRVVGINEQNNTDASHDVFCTLYPNPANNNLTVELNGFTGKVLYKVYDICGRNLLSSCENSERPGTIIKNLNVSSLADGTYLLHVLSEKTNVTRRFVVQK